MTWHNLRQQNEKPAGQPEPVPRRLRRAEGLGRRRLPRRLRGHRRHRHRRAGRRSSRRSTTTTARSCCKALADRLAEAFAEHLHQRVRTRVLGLRGGREALDNDDAHRREVPRHPSGAGLSGLPRPHREGRRSSSCSSAGSAGMTLTESFAMLPDRGGERLLLLASATRYFAVGKIERDQVDDYAHRKGMDLATMERWLAPVLAYDAWRAFPRSRPTRRRSGRPAPPVERPPFVLVTRPAAGAGRARISPCAPRSGPPRLRQELALRRCGERQKESRIVLGALAERAARAPIRPRPTPSLRDVEADMLAPSSRSAR